MAKDKFLKILNSNKKIRDENFKIDLNKNMKYEIYSLKIFNKMIDFLNFLFIILIFIFSFISLNRQREWTKFYSNMVDLRNKNNNLIDYISKTEEYFLKEIELKDNLKKASPADLIYLVKTKNLEEPNFLFNSLKEISNGFNDGKYQKGY